MTYEISAPNALNTTINLPSSKSISNRALVLKALSGNTATLENISQCDDTSVMLAAFRDMPYEIDIHAAGTSMRFLTAYLSTQEGEHIITGTERMRHRPIKILVEALRSLGADISYAGEEGYPPLLIKGHALNGGTLKVAGNISSQYISALLMIAPTMKKGLQLQLEGGITSRPYIDMTLSMMRQFGAHAEWASVDTIEVEAGNYSPTPFFVESDWSAASYWYEMAALSEADEDDIAMTGLMDGSSQGDSVVRYIFSLLGIKTSFGDKRKGVPTTVRLRKTSMGVGKLVFDFSGCPDLAQTVVCTCCGMGIPFDFTGLATLKIKETDRIEALKTELRKLGFVVRDIDGNRMLWDGERCEPSGEAIDTYEDHRMAMAFAPLALRMKGIKINNPEVVSKSYPEYWEHLKQAGFAF